MSQGIQYDVTALLRTEGAFTREMQSATKAADQLGGVWGRVGDRMLGVGDRIRGDLGSLATDLAKGGGAALGAGLTGGMAALTAKGIQFNNEMEQGALGLATMYQTFGVSDSFTQNIEAAQAMQRELVQIGDASPGTTEDMMLAYQSMAPGVSGVTQDLQRQADLMEKMAVMSWTTQGDYKQMGADVGRIVRGLAGADVAVFNTLQPAIEKAFTEVTGKAIDKDFAAQFNKLAKAEGETALKVFEKALEAVGPEVNEAFGNSFGGIVATVESKLMSLAGDFGKPLMQSIKDVMKYDLTGDGPLSDDAIGKLRELMTWSGSLMGQVFESAAGRLIRATDYIANNWQNIATMIRDAGVAAGAAIKAAIAIATTRLIVGTAVAAAGKALAGGTALIEASKPVGEFLAKQIKTTHTGLARGMKGKGSGIMGVLGKGLGAAGGKMADPLGFSKMFGGSGRSKGIDSGLLKVGSLVTTIGSLGAVAGVAGLALGGVAFIVGGLAAYVISNWEKISAEIRQGLESGRITLVPLITALYTFWERLKLVGQAFLGGADTAGMMQGGINLMTTAVDMLSGVLSITVKVIGYMVGAWALLKFGMYGVMKLIYKVVEGLNWTGVVDDETLERAKGNMENFWTGIEDTTKRSEDLINAADALAEAKLSPLDMKRAEADAKALEKKLSDFLSGKADDKDKRPKSPKVKIDKVVLEMDMRDPDPDRLMGALVKPFMRMADKRVSSYEGADGGV